MKDIFTKENLFFEYGKFKWYTDETHQKYVSSENAENLPALTNLGCFIVVGETVDYVMINDKQEIICSYPYPSKSDEYITKINMFKIAKHFDTYEKSNI